jgi:hypothetical protein
MAPSNIAASVFMMHPLFGSLASRDSSLAPLEKPASSFAVPISAGF